MLFPKTALLYGILLAILLEPISGRKGFGGGHSYPKSGGLSGGGHRTGGLSGGGHGYPSSGGSHGYPSSGGSHGYPSSGGSHGYPSGGLSGGSHGYPSSGGNRGSSGGSHGYPSSGGLSGSGHNYPSKPGSGYHATNNYHYTPPQQISYSPVHGGPPVNYPVYRGNPPNYVYQYKDSGSKYGTLLAGLALLNLGTLGVAGAAYAHSQSSKKHTAQPGEVCKFAVKKDNGDYEETKIDCNIISSFILQDQTQNQHGGTNSTVVTTTVTNTTTVNKANEMPMLEQTTTPVPVAPVLGNVLYAMLPNGTLVPVNASIPNIPGLPGAPENATHNETSAASPNGTMMTSSVVVTTTTTNTTVVDALDVKGAPVTVTPGMKCYVMRTSPTSNMRKSVPCGLLQTYAEKSISKNSAVHNAPMFTIITAILAFCIAY